MIEGHIDEKELKEKINALFNYRLFPVLFDNSNSLSQDGLTDFKDKLTELQAAIYYLDAHLEANWHTDPAVLDWHWRNIGQKLNNLGIDSSHHHMYLSHIKKYEKHELELRQNKSPLRFDMEYFYFYKSCDVKLIRRLIFEKLSFSKSYFKLGDWRYYDLVTEVNDDVEDVFEDLTFINGNRCLLSIMKYGKDKTTKDFESFLNAMKVQARLKFETTKQSDTASMIYTYTMQRIHETIEMLHVNMQNLTSEHVERSKLYPYIYKRNINEIV